METIIWVIGLLLAGVGGGLFGYQFRKLLSVKKRDRIETKVETLISEAKAKQKEILLEANAKALKIIEEAKRDERNRQQEATRFQQRLELRESLFDQKLLDRESQKQDLLEKVEKVKRLKDEVTKIREEQVQKLQEVASLTKEEAKQALFENLEREMADELAHRVRKIQTETQTEL